MRRIYALLDIASLVAAVRQGLAGVGPGAALILFAAALLSLPPALLAFWRFDLSSTFSFLLGRATPEAEAVAPAVAQAVAAQGLGGVTPGLVSAVLITGITLFPSFGEILLPRFASHPLADALLKIAIGFDFVTDWPTVWGGLGGWGALAQLGPLAPVVQAALCFLGTLVVSLFLQMLIILQLVVLTYATGAILWGGAGGRRGGRAQLIDVE